KSAIFVAADESLRFIGISQWVVEQTEFELPKQHRLNELVQFLLLQHTLAHQLHQMQITIWLRQFDIHASFDRQGAGLLFIGGDEMTVCVRPVAELPNCVVIRNNEALETPLLSEHVS